MCIRWSLFFFLSLILMACTGDSEKGAEKAKGPNADRGRRLYLVNCLTCHNRDPAKTGATGPAIKGSPEVLLEEKILHRRYPPGYIPKRNSAVMPAFKHLKKAIPDLAAFLR